MENSASFNPVKKSRWPKIAFAIMVLITAASITQTVRLQKQVAKLQNPQAAEMEQVKKTLDAISKLIVLPQGEDPSVAIVSDLEGLKGQAFFANAALGDQVIIYAKSKKAILWRPSENKIIEVAPINVDGSQTEADGSQEESAQ